MLEIGACLEIGSCLRSEAIYGDLTGYRDLTKYRDGWRFDWVQRWMEMGTEKERGHAYVKWQLREIINIEKNEYFVEISCKIDKLM